MHAINPIIYKVDDGFAGFAAELPGATGQGKTIDETIAEILSAIEELAAEYRRRNILVPWKVMAPVKPVEVTV
ncbi:type II toxin-antitoxin system HicB family antitoxin [bacterium]|nr:type II toxin-antitoxin system HicB family antitoxin [bacterium]